MKKNSTIFQTINRRNFLKVSTTALASNLFLPQLSFAEQKADIVVAKGDPQSATRLAIQKLGGIAAFVKPGQKVVIKPNMSFTAGPENATNTHPLVVQEVLKLCLEAKASSVLVLDHAFQSGNKMLEYSGILDACNAIAPNSCFNYTQSRYYQDIFLDQAQEMKNNAILRAVMEADVIISVPVAKSHASTGVSLSIKGQMGLILDRGSMHFRYDLDSAIVDLFAWKKPSLVVIDATRVLTTGGPSGPGKIITPSEIIASADPVAADACTVASYEWYGRKIKPQQVVHLKMAAKRGLGRLDLENLNILKITA